MSWHRCLVGLLTVIKKVKIQCGQAARAQMCTSSVCHALFWRIRRNVLLYRNKYFTVNSLAVHGTFHWKKKKNAEAPACYVLLWIKHVPSAAVFKFSNSYWSIVKFKQGFLQCPRPTQNPPNTPWGEFGQPPKSKILDEPLFVLNLCIFQ